jgi:hypothetical protein
MPQTLHQQRRRMTSNLRRDPHVSPRRSREPAEHRQTDLHTAPDREITNAPPMPRGTQRARFVGTTRDGQWIFEAPSGDAVLNLPNDDQDRRSSRRRRHHHRDEADGGQQGLPEQPLPRTFVVRFHRTTTNLRCAVASAPSESDFDRDVG